MYRQKPLEGPLPLKGMGNHNHLIILSKPYHMAGGKFNGIIRAVKVGFDIWPIDSTVRNNGNKNIAVVNTVERRAAGGLHNFTVHRLPPLVPPL